MTGGAKGAESFGRMLLICCGITFIAYFATSTRLPVVPLFAKSLGLDAARIGVINAVFFLVAGALSLPLGMASDRTGHRVMAGAGLGLLGGAAFLLIFCQSFGWLVAAYMLFGVGTAAFGPTMMSLVAHIAPMSHLSRAYGWYTTALFCGMSLGPAAGGLVAGWAGYRAVFAGAGCLLLADLWLLAARMPAAEKETGGGGGRGRPASLRTLLRNRPLISCWMVTFGGAFGLGMFTSFIPLHAENQGLDVGRIGLIFFAQGLCNALSRIPFGHLGDRVADRSRLVVIGVIAFGAAMGGFGLSRSLSAFVFFALIMGAGMGMAFTAIGALVAVSVQPQDRGVAMGGYNTCIYGGMMASAAVMGLIIEVRGHTAAFIIAGGLQWMLIGLFYLLMRGAGGNKGPWRAGAGSEP